jgi:hypothetical protein
MFGSTKTVVNGMPIKNSLEITFSVDFSNISKFYLYVDRNFLYLQENLSEMGGIDQGPVLPLVGVRLALGCKA